MKLQTLLAIIVTKTFDDFYLNDNDWMIWFDDDWYLND